jgi:hypothetical protein
MPKTLGCGSRPEGDIHMRTRTGLCLLACCAALTACTANAPSRPDAAVTTPAVGRPPAPASAEAALSSEAFTPYAALGLSSNDGLAPGESTSALAGVCMTAEGYPGAAAAAQADPVDLGQNDGLVAATHSGGWGYLTAADAQQYGFLGSGEAVSALGLYSGPVTNFASLPQAEQAVANKCITIEQDFVNAVDGGPLAGIGTLSNDIATDMQHDPAVKNATQAWSACVAGNGYDFDKPQAMARQETLAAYGIGNGPGPKNINPAAAVSAAANQAQIAAAVADAGCTQSSDLAGIYFAVQASYEQQLVSANQQALSAAVGAYRAAYAKALKELSAMLRTAQVQPFPKASRGARR